MKGVNSIIRHKLKTKAEIRTEKAQLKQTPLEKKKLLVGLRENKYVGKRYH